MAAEDRSLCQEEIYYFHSVRNKGHDVVLVYYGFNWERWRSFEICREHGSGLVYIKIPTCYFLGRRVYLQF